MSLISLLAESVTQFQASAYKELLPSDGPSKNIDRGFKNTGYRTTITKLVKEHMNYLLMEKMEDYTTDMDQMSFYLPLSGSTCLKKYIMTNFYKRPCSKFIPAEDLVVPYYASDLKDAGRITHVIKMTENDINKKMAAGFYRDADLPKPQQKKDEVLKMQLIKS